MFSRFRSPSCVSKSTQEAALGSRKEIQSAGRSSRTASVLQLTEKVGEPGGHELLNRVLCPEPATNGVADMTRHRPGRRMDFPSCGR